MKKYVREKNNWLDKGIQKLLDKPLFSSFVLLFLIITTIISGINNIIIFIPNIRGLCEDVFYGSEDKINDIREYKFLMFSNKEDFDKWHKEVNFKLGLPKYGRRLSTDKVDTVAVGSEKYAIWVTHPNGIDKRGICSFDWGLPDYLINEEAERKYNFTKITFRQAEEIGFISDEKMLKKEYIDTFRISSIKNINGISYDQVVKYNRKGFTGLTFDIFLFYNLMEDKRNKYIFDIAYDKIKNRISLYFDSNNNLNFRVIDRKSDSYIIQILSDDFCKHFYVSCKIYENHLFNKLSVSINGSKVAEKNYENIDLDLDNPFEIIIGNSIDKFYGARINIKYLTFDICNYINQIEKQIIYNISYINPKDPTSIVLDGNRVSQMYNRKRKYSIE